MNLSPNPSPTQRQSLDPWVSYVVPMATFLGLTTVEGMVGNTGYLWLYALKVILVSVLLWCFSQPLQDLRPRRRDWLWVSVVGLLVGLLVFAEWIWLDHWIPYPHLGERVGYNPFEELPGWGAPLFIGLRLYGLVLVVPVMEELFWRSFLLRYLTGPDFTKVPIAQFSWAAFAIVAVAFGLAHSEWLVAIICACAYALLLKYTRSLWACLVAHSVTNLALGIYVLGTQAWIYW